MTDAATRTLTITLPAEIVEQYRLGTPILSLSIVEDSKIQGGKRAITRTLRDANASDPGRIRRIEWELWGPIGNSIWSSSQALGLDFARNMETRWERRLLAPIVQNDVSLSGDDPPGTGAYFGTAYFGSSYFGTGASSGADVVCFDEQSGYLFAHRGPTSTQVDYSGWSVVDSVTHDANVRWAEHWYGKGRIALGPSTPMLTRTGVNGSGATYAATVSTSPSASVYANYVRRGSDRAWIIDANEGGSYPNYAGFTLDGFVNMALPFQVGDPLSGVNGIGPFGPVTSFGSTDQISSFTDQGKPVPLSKALDTIQSTLNGQQFADPGWGWNYYLSITGLRAHDLRGNDNPIGVGERMRSFTGHNGIATAIFATRGELWVVYQTSAGDLYGYRGAFGPETGGTGQPVFFPWFYQAAGTCKAIFASSTPNVGTQNLTVIRANGTDMTYETIAANGRDDLASLSYSTEGGTWWGTMLDQNPNLLRTLRLLRVRARNMFRGDSFALAMGFDTDPIDPVGSAYTTIGTVTEDGFHTVTPVSNRIPLAGISGRTMKPRITQVASGSVTNYITNPTGAAGTTGWSFGSGGGSASNSEFTISGGTGSGFTIAGQIPITLVANTTYIANVKVNIPADGVATYTALSVIVSGLSGATGNLTANANMALRGQYQTIQIGPFTTASDVTGTFTVSPSVTGFGSVSYKEVMVANYTEQIPYFDGNSGAGYAWTGTADLSTSVWTPGVTNPPELDGTLEVEYDERPEQIEVTDVVIEVDGSSLNQNTLWAILRDLKGSQTDGPFKIQLPSDNPPGVSLDAQGGQKYAMLADVVNRTDMKDDSIEAVGLTLHTWPQASAI